MMRSSYRRFLKLKYIAVRNDEFKLSLDDR